MSKSEAAPPAGARPLPRSASVERLGIVGYTNVAPLHWRLEPDVTTEFVRGVPTELNRLLLAGEIDLTLMSSIEFLRHRRELRALPDFSIATLGTVYSVVLLHWRPWHELAGARVAVTSESATSVALLRLLFAADGLDATMIAMPPDPEAMLRECDAALLIGDVALREALQRRAFAGRQPQLTDLGEAWYRLTRLPFTFAVWASRRDRPPSPALVARLRAAREAGLGHLAEVAAVEAARLGLPALAVQRYLGNFRYYFELPDRDGLLAFAARALPGALSADAAADEITYWNL